MAYWFGFAAVAGAFGGLLAFGVQNIHANIQNWRLLFIIEGIPAVLLGILTIFFLPNRPESTTFLTERERAIALDRMNRATSGDTGAVVNRSHVRMAFKDWRIYTAGVIYFGLNCALASISAFLPTILKTLNYTNARAQLFTVPPYAVAAVVLVGFSYASDRVQSRGFFMAASCSIGAIGYLLLLTVHENLRVRYFATFCITSGTYTTIGLIIAWFAHNLGSETKKATGIPMFMAIGQCGSVLGSHIYPKTQGPAYTQGFAIGCALEFLGAVCCIILSISYRRENARRDKLYGKPVDNARVDTHELADQAPNFRYMP
jgi:sugar phosphate permease